MKKEIVIKGTGKKLADLSPEEQAQAIAQLTDTLQNTKFIPDDFYTQINETVDRMTKMFYQETYKNLDEINRKVNLQINDAVLTLLEGLRMKLKAFSKVYNSYEEMVENAKSIIPEDEYEQLLKEKASFDKQIEIATQHAQKLHDSALAQNDAEIVKASVKEVEQDFSQLTGIAYTKSTDIMDRTIQAFSKNQNTPEKLLSHFAPTTKNNDAVFDVVPEFESDFGDLIKGYRVIRTDQDGEYYFSYVGHDISPKAGNNIVKLLKAIFASKWSYHYITTNGTTTPIIIVSVRIKDLVNKGIYKNADIARRSVQKLYDDYLKYFFSGYDLKRGKANSGALFQNLKRERGIFYFQLNGEFDWNVLIGQFVFVPSYFYKLTGDAPRILKYVFELSKTSSKRKEILKNGGFNISCKALLSAIGCPTEYDRKKSDKVVQGVIKGLDDIEETHRKTFNNDWIQFDRPEPVIDMSVREWMDNGTIFVRLGGDFLEQVILAENDMQEKIKRLKTKNKRQK